MNEEMTVVKPGAEPLTKSEQAKLEKLEKTIDAGKNTFVMVGLALTEIRDSRLYRAKYPSFEEYCQDRWGWKSSRARQLIAAASVVKGLEPGEAAAVTHEQLARKLVRVPKEKRGAVIKAAVESGKKMTTSLVAEEARILMAAEVPAKDNLGRDIPKYARKYWERKGEVTTLLNTISKVKSILQQARNDEDLMFVEVSESAITDLDKAWTSVQCAKPFCVCPTCQGHPLTQPNKQCRMCMGRGLISKFRWDHTVPDSLKQIVIKTLELDKAKEREKLKAQKAAAAEKEAGSNGKEKK